MGIESRKWHNKIIFWIIILVAFGIISITIITDICIIKKHCCSKSIEQITSTVVDKIPDVDYQISVTDSLTTKSNNETIPQSISLDSLNHNTNHQATTTEGLVHDNNASNLQSHNLDSIVYYLTLAVDTVNSVLSGGAIALGILTLFLGLVGLFGYNTLKEDINDKTHRFKETLDNQSKDIVLFKEETKEQIESIEERFNGFMNKYESLVQSLNAQEQYTNKSIEYLYEAIYLFLNNPGSDGLNGSSPTSHNGPDDGSNGPVGGTQDILNDLFHKLQILKLYRCSLDEDEDEARTIKHGKKTALEFLAENGTKNDLPDLIEVAKHEQDESIKNRIHEVIGIIRFKYS